MSLLYIIAPMLKGPCKIGHTANIRKRLVSIQIGCFLDLELHSTWQHPSLKASDCESQVHGQLMRDHMRGEWFAVEVAKAEEIAASIGMHHAAAPPLMDTDAIQQALARGRAINTLKWPI